MYLVSYSWNWNDGTTIFEFLLVELFLVGGNTGLFYYDIDKAWNFYVPPGPLYSPKAVLLSVDIPWDSK